MVGRMSIDMTFESSTTGVVCAGALTRSGVHMICSLFPSVERPLGLVRR